MRPDVTVLVPLHRSGRFLGVIEDNLRTVADVAAVVISDATEVDETLSVLARTWHDHPNVVLLGKRGMASGWVSHYNDLLSRCETDYFMWLAHDDSIGADYVVACRDALVRDPDVAGAFGRLLPVEGEGLDVVHTPEWPADTVGGSPGAAVAAATGWNPGIAFRSVFRRAEVGAIMSPAAEHLWADYLWVFSLLTHKHLRFVPSVSYHKRWYPGSEHRGWPRDAYRQVLAPMLTAVLARHHDTADAEHGIARVVEWAITSVREQSGREDDLRREAETLRRDVAAAQDHLALALSQRDAARASLRALRSSRSWLLARRLSRFASRLRR